MELACGGDAGPERAGRLKVMVFTPGYPSDAQPWVSTFVKSQLDALAETGVDFRIFTITSDFPFVWLYEVDRDGRQLTQERRLNGSAHLAALIHRNKLWTGACDVVLAQGQWPPTALRGISLPLVGVLRDVGAMTLSGSWRDPIRKRIIVKSLRRLDRIVSVGVPPLFDLPPDIRDRTTILSNGVNRDIYAYRGVPAAARVAAPDFPRFVTVGRMDPNKNHELLLRNFHRVRQVWPNATWLIIGEGVRRPHLERVCDELGLRGSVRFTGQLPPREIAAVLTTCDLHVLPTQREAFGNVYLEAMSVGVPTIMPRNSGIAFVARDERYLHNPMDIDEIIAKARAILGTAESYERAVGFAQDMARSCTWEAHAARLREVLESVCRRAPRQATPHLLTAR